MTQYEEGLSLLTQKFGHGKDNIISLATIAREPASGGLPMPAVRCVDAYYEDRCFYCVTYSGSNKMLQIDENANVALAMSDEMFTAAGTGKNLGWVMLPENAELRQKLRAAFAAWYDIANDESDKSCCILAIQLTKGILNVNHWEKLYHMDFVSETEIENGGIR